MAARPVLDATADHVRQIEELAGHGLTQEQIADFFGWSSRTLRNRLTEVPEFAAAYKHGRANAINTIAKTLYQKAVNGDTVSCLFFLKTQAGWRETNRTEFTGKDGGPVQVDDRAALDHVRRELARLAAARDPAPDPRKPQARSGRKS